MAKAVVIRDIYKDSIELMQISAHVQESVAGVLLCSVMVATPANLQLMGDLGFSGLDQLGATSSDLIIAIKANSDESATKGLELANDVALGKKSLPSVAKKAGAAAGGPESTQPKSFQEALQQLQLQEQAPSKSPMKNWTLISVPGEFAAAEALKAIRGGWNVFLFSDNVSIEEEAMLKREAASRGLYVAGPDCGTMLLNQVPFAFANQVRPGRIGLVGASGTGLQEVSCLIDRMGSGCSAVLGTGGRDLHDDIGGTMMIKGIEFLANDPNTDVVVVIAKKAPSTAVQKQILDRIRAVVKGKRVVVNYLGMDQPAAAATSSGIQFASTLEDAAILAVHGKLDKVEIRLATNVLAESNRKNKQGRGYGLFSGGTFSYEAYTLLNKNKDSAWELIDFGEDQYCVGKPHPMIDLTTRMGYLSQTVGSDTDARVVIMDLVLGHGSNLNPAPVMAETLKKLAQVNPVPIVLSIVGVAGDPQKVAEQQEILQKAYPNLVVAQSNAQAVLLAKQFFDHKPSLTVTRRQESSSSSSSSSASTSNSCSDIQVINVGLPSFSDAIRSVGAKVTQIEWRPPCAGIASVGLDLANIMFDEKIDKANQEAIDRLQRSTAMFTEVALDGAKSVLSNLPKSDRWLLHSGPPVQGGWQGLCSPMKGAMIGAMLFEGWAKTPEEAEALGASGKVILSPCHEHGAVGPMAGVVSPSMPMLKVVNEPFNTAAYATMNEGLGKVLRMGAYSDEVLQRLRWMKDELAPTIDKAVRSRGGIDVRSITAQALQMGDECHNRNVAATSLITRHLALAISKQSSAEKTLEFLLGNDHFFLNLSMAACKSALDAANGIENCTIVTAMARNGVDFGIRMSGTGNEWFVDKAAVVKGLYFAGYSEKDANPDLGDSSITETYGIGGFAMAAAPAITRFVGGDAESSKYSTLEMDRITIARHKSFQIPNLDFRGPPLGIDARLVADRSIQPVINTGIAHKQAGIGQVGAGIARAPIRPFGMAIARLAMKMAKRK